MAVARVLVRRIAQPESRNYYVLLGTTLFMVVFGLIMVLSSSDVDSYAAGGNYFGVFLNLNPPMGDGLGSAR